MFFLKRFPLGSLFLSSLTVWGLFSPEVISLCFAWGLPPPPLVNQKKKINIHKILILNVLLNVKKLYKYPITINKVIYLYVFMTFCSEMM